MGLMASICLLYWLPMVTLLVGYWQMFHCWWGLADVSTLGGVSSGVGRMFHHIQRVCSLWCVHTTIQPSTDPLQQESAEIVVIQLYCCGLGCCSRYPLLYYFFQNNEGS